jgi:hypothetical protein
MTMVIFTVVFGRLRVALPAGKPWRVSLNFEQVKAAGVGTVKNIRRPSAAAPRPDAYDLDHVGC